MKVSGPEVGNVSYSPPPNNKPPHPPNNKYSPNMVYYNILGIFIIRVVGGFITRGGDYLNPG